MTRGKRMVELAQHLHKKSTLQITKEESFPVSQISDDKVKNDNVLSPNLQNSEENELNGVVQEEVMSRDESKLTNGNEANNVFRPNLQVSDDYVVINAIIEEIIKQVSISVLQFPEDKVNDDNERNNVMSTNLQASEDNVMDNLLQEEYAGDFSGTDSDKSYRPVDSDTSTDSDSTTNSSSNNVLPKSLALGSNISAVRNLASDLEEERKSKKRLRNEENWAKNKKKKQVNSGQAYLTASGRQREAKQLKTGCSEKCKLKCTKNFTEEQRESIFQKFYDLADRTRQRDFLSKCMQITSPRKYRRENATRKLNYAYYLYLNEKKRRVCKLFFKNTLAITNTAITTAQKKTNSEGITLKDLRGYHSKHKTLPVITKQSVRDHINKFPRIESHYCRADTKREYLEGDLSISTMYRLYVEQCRDNGVIPAKHSMYAYIFNTEFNIAFFKPKKDQCAKCASFQNASPEEKLNLKENHDTHLLEKNAARSMKSKDIANAKESNKNISIFDYDLQAVVPLPIGEVSTFYYKCKLNFINFTISDVLTKDGTCYSWHEGVAKRGANEIGTCVYLFLQNLGRKSEVIFYSDNCGGQNKNKFILTMYLYAVQTLQIDVITHNFLIMGHTQNDSDNIHSVIEREKRRLLRSGPIYTPAQMAMVLKSAKKTGNPYSVNELSSEQFYDWKNLSSIIGKNFNIDDDGKKLVWGNIKTIRVKKERPFEFEYKTSFIDESITGIVNIRKKQRGKVPSLKLEKAYSGPQAISAHKKRDLMSLCSANLVPKCHHAFFENLKSTIENNNSSQIIESEDSE